MIFVECNPDELLVRYITSLTRREVVHELKGKGEVCNRLRKQAGATGLVDEDPTGTQPHYIREARLIEENLACGLKVLHHDRSGNRIIVVCPRLEEWILAGAKEAGIDVRKYGLANEARKLHSEINLSLEKFGKLLADMDATSSRLKALRATIESCIKCT